MMLRGERDCLQEGGELFGPEMADFRYGLGSEIAVHSQDKRSLTRGICTSQHEEHTRKQQLENNAADRILSYDFRASYHMII